MNDGLLFDASDEEELREQLDMHSIIVSCVNEEPLFTADQVWSGSQGLRASWPHYGPSRIQIASSINMALHVSSGHICNPSTFEAEAGRPP